MSYLSLQERHILVTGGGSGIGLATVEALLAQGAYVSAADVSLTTLDRLVPASGGKLSANRVDVTSEAEVADWVGRSVATHGPVDGLVVSAGIEPEDDAPVHELSMSAWSRTLDVNMTGAFLTCREAVGAMARDGRAASVVMIGSPTGHFGLELGHHAYSASKGGFSGLGRVMAAEYASFGIRVNIVWPGLIDTPLNDFVTRDSLRLESELAAIPQRRMGHPAEIAAMALFLLSDQSSYCTGGIFTVDGGLTG